MIIKKNKKQQNTPQQEEIPQEQAPHKEEQKPQPKPKNLLESGIFSDEEFLDTFQQRQERRRGDRRRGYRRTDDRNIISRAKDEADDIKEQATKEGFAHGLNLAKGSIEELKATIADLLSIKEKAMDKYKEDIVDIALKIAEKLLKKQVQADETIILNILEEVLSDVAKDEKHIIIKINPEDEQIVRENITSILPSSFSDTKISLEKNNQIDRGSCIVETKSGVIDAQFSTQLIILKNALK